MIFGNSTETPRLIANEKDGELHIADNDVYAPLLKEVNAP